MSIETRPTDPAILAYVADHTWPEPEVLARLRKDARAAGLPAISIGPVQARFLQIVLSIAGARHVVEVGTLGGYSALAMVEALPADGSIDTIEAEPRHASFAREAIAAAGESERIRVQDGGGLDVLPGLADDSADAIFIDADKESYGAYLDEGLRIVRPGGLILVDNAFAFGRLLDESCADEDVAAIRAFNERMAAHPRVQGQIVAVGDGLWVGVKRA